LAQVDDHIVPLVYMLFGNTIHRFKFPRHDLEYQKWK
jgi:hypothetical protein